MHSLVYETYQALNCIREFFVLAYRFSHRLLDFYCINGSSHRKIRPGGDHLSIINLRMGRDCSCPDVTIIMQLRPH